jgi:hypothetical protein
VSLESTAAMNLRLHYIDRATAIQREDGVPGGLIGRARDG